MIRAVVWKEFREQWVIALALVVLGGGLLAAAAALGDPPAPGASPLEVIKSLGLGRIAALMLVVTAGTVRGGALFAAEREAGTLTFLEVLPGARAALWGSKVVAGVALALAQTAALLAVAAALGLMDPVFAVRLLLYGLLAFAWGTLGSTLARTTLGSIGVSVPAASVTCFAYLFPISVFFAPPGSSMPRPAGWVVFSVLMLVTPLAVSAWRFTATDRARARGRGAAASDTRALVWLAVRQARVTGTVLSAFALVFGFALLLPDGRPVFVLPVLALAAGVLAGVTAFGDEQAHRIAPFWAENRLPIGRAWTAKIGMHLVLVGWLLLLVTLPSAVRAQIESQGRFSHGRTTFAAIFHDRMFDELGSQAWKYLLVPAVYGFAAGHLCGLLFRKLVVACGVALIAGGSLSALWGPSLLAGGVWHWQVWLPAAALLLTGRLVVRAWASDRMVGRGPLLRLAGGTGAALLAFAFGIGYRVFEVPENPAGEDDIAFVNALPTYDENVAGREFRAASERYSRVVLIVEQEPEGRAVSRVRPRLDERLDLALRTGWPPARVRVPLWKWVQPDLSIPHGRPPGDADLAAWLDRMFSTTRVGPDETPWPVMAEVAGTRPLGVFEPPQLIGTPAVSAAGLDNARRMAVALLVRGLQQQAAGEPEAFRPKFSTVMALARTLRNGSGVAALRTGIEVERLALLAAERWLERFNGRAALLRDMTREVERYETRGELDLLEHYYADRYVMRELMRVPGPWLSTNLIPIGGSPDQASEEADLVGFAWTVPWERERTRRLLGLGYEQGPQGGTSAKAAFVSGRPGAAMLLTRNRAVGDVPETDRNQRVARRALVLSLAARAYLSERGSVPAALGDLTAGADPYLKALPEDPYADGRPLGYRVSAGETLRGPPRTGGRGGGDPLPITIPPGQIVIWSVGADRADQGGSVVPGNTRSEDIVFLVPMSLPAPK